MDELLSNFLIASVVAAVPVVAWFSFLAFAKRLSETPSDQAKLER